MKHAVLADIHGNDEALIATLDAARSFGVQHLLLLGDYVGYYYAADAVIQSLREWPHAAVLGNHDRRALMAADAAGDPTGRIESRPKDSDTVTAHLSESSLEWLGSLEDVAHAQRGRFTVLCAHGTPRDVDEYLYPDAELDAVAACGIEGVDIVFLGHTHHPMIALTTRGTVVVNPGSVGQARDLGGFASWCLFDDETGAIRPVRTAYDPRHVWDQARRNDPSWSYGRRVLEQNNPCLQALFRARAAAHDKNSDILGIQ